MVQIQRLRAMANEALADYQSSLLAGGESIYPQWAQDIIAVCAQAEVSLQFENENMDALRCHLPATGRTEFDMPRYRR
jgi:hypothetical protein